MGREVGLPAEIWERTVPIRDAVLGMIEDLAPPTNNYAFTNVLEDEPSSAADLAKFRSRAQRRGSLFLSVMLTCDIRSVSRGAPALRKCSLRHVEPPFVAGRRLMRTAHTAGPNSVPH